MLGRVMRIDSPFRAASTEGIVKVIALEIGIDLVGVGGKQQRDLSRGRPWRRKNKQGNDILFGARFYADAIDTTWQVGRYVKDKIRVPGAIIQIVLVKMHSSILIGRF